MDSPLLTLVTALWFGFFAAIVDSQENVNPPAVKLSPPPPSSPLPPAQESPRPPFTQPPRPFAPPPPFLFSKSSRFSPPPPLSLLPPFTPPPPLSLSPPFAPPPPLLIPHSPPSPLPRKRLRPPVPGHGKDNSRENLIRPPKKEKLNMGQKIGFMFIGVAAILQVCVVAFLLIRKKQILKAENSY